MKLHADFTFDRAGQGLFYYGQIYNDKQRFSIVYDCGTLGSIKGATHNLSEIICNFNLRPCRYQPIGLLAISHFDFDHISHIPELLTKNQVDTVMMPHVASEVRAAYLAKCLIETCVDIDNVQISQDRRLIELVALFNNPERYFYERGRARQVIGIESNGDPFDGYENNDMPKLMEDSWEDGYPRLFYDGNRRPTIENKKYNYKVYSDAGAPVFRVRICGMYWLFRPLNVQEALPQCFYDDVKKILNGCGDDWKNLLSDMKTIKALQKLYDCHIGRANRNAHSLLLRHEPEGYKRLYTWPKLNLMELKRRSYVHSSYKKSATVLLGDLKIVGKADTILNKNKFLDDGVGVILIPHHGAESADLEWLDKKVEDHYSRATLVVSYGTKNKYCDRNGHRHPRFIYDGTVATISSLISFSNEKQKYEYHMNVYY